MPRLTKATPKYRKHRASGQAVVTIEGHDFYLGPHRPQATGHVDFSPKQWTMPAIVLAKLDGPNQASLQLNYRYVSMGRSIFVDKISIGEKKP